MKQMYIVIFIIIFCFGITGCSKSNSLDGMYIGTGRDYSNYPEYWDYKFYNGKYMRNDIVTEENSGTGTYIVKEDNSIILYMNGDESRNWKLGYLYESYICRLFTGDINKEITSFSEIYDVNYGHIKVQERYCFSNGKYELYVTTPKVKDHLVEEGTYVTEDNKVICKANELPIAPVEKEMVFLLADDKIYLVLYEKK